MNEPVGRYSALWQLFLARFREFYREPQAIFWVYGFPLLIALALGIAFRERAIDQVRVDVVADPDGGAIAETVAQTLRDGSRPEMQIIAEVSERTVAQRRYERSKTDLVVEAKPLGDSLRYECGYDRNRAESVLARAVTDSILLRSDKSRPMPSVEDPPEEGKRKRKQYIDFLLPGLMAMNLMGGGLFGVGFVIVDLRVRKLLKRYTASPMRRSDFLLSVGLSRSVVSVTEVLVLLGFGWLGFGVAVPWEQLPLLIAMIMVVAGTFMGLGLLVACRAKTSETVGGLVNLTMLPQYVLSGVFFSSERFPEWMQPIIQVLPLTAAVNVLRGVMMDGSGLGGIWPGLVVLVVWGVGAFGLALWWFRWK